MGYRGTLITVDEELNLPDWFVDKHKDRYNFGGSLIKPSLPISSKFEVSRFSDDLEEDFVKVLNDKKSARGIIAVWLFEDGNLNQIVFTKNGVLPHSEWENL